MPSGKLPKLYDNKQWEEQKHQIFKEKLYKFAYLPKLEFDAKIEVFKAENPDLIAEKVRIDISKYQLMKFIKEFRWDFDK